MMSQSNLQKKKKKANLSLPSWIIDTFLANHVFDGARCDITKVLTPNFQVTHSFAMGAAGSASTYNFGTAFIGQQASRSTQGH